MVEEIHAGKDVKEVDIDRLLAELIERYKKHVRSRRFLPGFTKADIAPARKRYGKEIREIIAVVLGPKAAKGTIGRALVQLGAETPCRDVVTDIRSGLVVAGFGEQEYMPALIEYQLEEMALGKLRYVEVRDAVIDSRLSSVVIPFAQQEMVYSFMEGIDKGLLEWMEGSTFDVLAGVVDEIVKKVGDADPALGTELKKAMAGWMKRREEFWKPVLSTTRALPKDELAAMAEALVNLTKFRRRVTMDRETVGGPIDVAVITKGDGFVWVKRTHYFEAEYNPRVIARYQQGGSHGTADSTSTQRGGCKACPRRGGGCPAEGGDAAAVCAVAARARRGLRREAPRGVPQGPRQRRSQGGGQGPPRQPAAQAGPGLISTNDKTTRHNKEATHAGQRRGSLFSYGLGAFGGVGPGAESSRCQSASLRTWKGGEVALQAVLPEDPAGR